MSSCLQARVAAQVLTQEVDSLSARLTSSALLGLDSAKRFSKEIGVLSDVSTQDALRPHTEGVFLLFDPVLCLSGC